MTSAIGRGNVFVEGGHTIAVGAHPPVADRDIAVSKPLVQVCCFSVTDLRRAVSEAPPTFGCVATDASVAARSADVEQAPISMPTFGIIRGAVADIVVAIPARHHGEKRSTRLKCRV